MRNTYRYRPYIETHCSTNLITRGLYRQQVCRAEGEGGVEGTMGHRPIINITIKKTCQPGQGY